MTVTHEVDDRLPAVDAYLSACEKFDELVCQLRAAQTKRMTHTQLETLLEIEGRELLRRLLQAHLDERSPGTVAALVVGADGQARTHQRLHTRQLETIFGVVSVNREGYGARDSTSLHPLDAELNLPPERYSYTLRRRVAEAAAHSSYAEVVAALTSQLGKALPKRQVEELVERAAQDFEAFYATQRQMSDRQLQSSSELLVISTDGKGVPVRHADLRAPTRAAADSQEPHLKHRRSKGEKSYRKRISTVATVYTIAPWGRTPAQIVGELSRTETVGHARPQPEHKRVWASLQHSPAEVIAQAFAEARGRDPSKRKRWVALVDGNPTQLALLETAAKQSAVSLTIVLDLIHVLEYLWRAAWALFAETDPAAETWVQAHLEQLLHGRSSQVAAGLRRSATLRALHTQRREPLDKCADYLLKYRPYLHYDHYLASGLPIATGVIEGACRHLVKDRMELTGARWSLTGAEAVLQLRSVRVSGDFEEYWHFHLQQEMQRNHVAHYANAQVPMPNPEPTYESKSQHFRLIK